MFLRNHPSVFLGWPHTLDKYWLNLMILAGTVNHLMIMGDPNSFPMADVGKHKDRAVRFQLSKPFVLGESSWQRLTSPLPLPLYLFFAPSPWCCWAGSSQLLQPAVWHLRDNAAAGSIFALTFKPARFVMFFGAPQPRIIQRQWMGIVDFSLCLLDTVGQMYERIISG